MGRKRQGISVKLMGEKWVVNVPAYLIGQRQRGFFSTRAEAEHFADQFRSQLAKYGSEGVQRIQSGELSVNSAITRFWSSRELHGQHLKHAQFYFTHFAKMFGDAAIRMIGPLDLEKFWKRKNWSPTTRAQAFRYVQLLFNWAERYDLIDRNPARRVEPPKCSKPPKRILTPPEMSRLIELATGSQKAFLCLGGFAGLRTSEALAFLPEDVDQAHIHVRNGKTGPRYIEATPIFHHHWPNVPVKPKSQQRFYKSLKPLIAQMGWKEWPDNCLRHSFASYHLALHQDASKTAFQLGHTSTAMVYRAYARAVRKEAAVQWFSLGISTEKIVAFSG